MLDRDALDTIADHTAIDYTNRDAVHTLVGARLLLAPLDWYPDWLRAEGWHTAQGCDRFLALAAFWAADCDPTDAARVARESEVQHLGGIIRKLFDLYGGE